MQERCTQLVPKAVNHSGCAINTAHSAIRSQDLAHCSQSDMLPLDHCDQWAALTEYFITGVLAYDRKHIGLKNRHTCAVR